MLLYVSRAVTYIGGLLTPSAGASDDFLGNWDALNNVPAISDGSADDDQYYIVSVAGSRDLGSGVIAFAVSDIVRQVAGVWINAGPAPQVQTDWNENNPVSPAFLVNRPTSLTNGDNADTLHKHSLIQNPAGDAVVQAISAVVSIFTGAVERLRVLANGNLLASAYPQTRNDGTINDLKVLTTDASGNVLLRRVLPFSSIVSTTVGKLNQSTTLLTYHTHPVTIPEAGTYSIVGHYVWSFNTTAQNFLGRVRLDAVTLVEHIQAPSDAGGVGVSLERLDLPGNFVNSGTSQRLGYSIARAVVLTAGAHTLDVQVAGGAVNEEAAIYECTTIIRRES